MEALLSDGYGAIVREMMGEEKSGEGVKKPEPDDLSAMSVVLNIEYQELLSQLDEEIFG